MAFCSECGTKIFESNKYCNNCGFKLKEDNEKHKSEKNEPRVERLVEKHYIEKPRKSGIGKLILLLIALGLIALGVVAFINSGALDEVAGGSGVPYVDPCEREFSQCNHDCGEGVLSGLCKEKCTYQLNKCNG